MFEIFMGGLLDKPVYMQRCLSDLRGRRVLNWALWQASLLASRVMPSVHTMGNQGLAVLGVSARMVPVQ